MSSIGSANPAAGFRPSAEDGKSGPGVDFNPQVPVGPAPQVTSFQTASAQTMAQKQALLDAIAQNGTAGKQVFAQQQQAMQGLRQGAIQTQLQGQFAQYGGGGDLAAADNLGLQNTAAAQNAIDSVSNADARGNSAYYDAINAQIPLAQAHTQQQVNAIKSRQDLARQAFEQEQARLAEEAQMRREEHAASMAQAQVELAKAQGKNMSPQEAQRYADEHQAATDLHNSRDDKATQTPEQNALLQDALEHLGGLDSNGYQVLSRAIGNSKNMAQALATLSAGIKSGNALFKTPSGRPLDTGVIVSYLHRYYGQ